MDRLINYLMADFEGHNEIFTRMDLSAEQFRQIITTRGMRIGNVERFVFEWRGYHPQQKEIPKIWHLLFMKHWEENYYTRHLYEFYKHGMMDEHMDRCGPSGHQLKL